MIYENYIVKVLEGIQWQKSRSSGHQEAIAMSDGVSISKTQ